MDTVTITRTRIVIIPRDARLMLRSRKPTVKVSDHEREAEQNRERQERWRERQIDPRRSGIVEWGGAVLTMLIETEHLSDDQADDPKAVTKAITEMLQAAAEAQTWKK